MPKLKTKRAAAKRFKISGTGKLIFKGPGKSHLLEHKSRKRKRTLRNDRVISDANRKAMKLCTPFM